MCMTTPDASSMSCVARPPGGATYPNCARARDSPAPCDGSSNSWKHLRRSFCWAASSYTFNRAQTSARGAAARGSATLPSRRRRQRAHLPCARRERQHRTAPGGIAPRGRLDQAAHRRTRSEVASRAALRRAHLRPGEQRHGSWFENFVRDKAEDGRHRRRRTRLQRIARLPTGRDL